jgi:hypothetical protein
VMVTGENEEVCCLWICALWYVVCGYVFCVSVVVTCDL